MTRGIALTYALLYLRRIKTCFHCSGSAASQQKLGQSPNNSGNINIQTTNRPPTVSVYPRKDQTQLSTFVIALQCALFFAVGMHYASLWLLDYCPSENVYWYVDHLLQQCLPPS